MRSMLALLVGMGVVIALGIWFAHSMTPQKPDEVATDGGFPLWPLAFVAWATVLVQRPLWLSLLLFMGVGFVGLALLVIGGLAAYWESHLGGGGRAAAHQGIAVGLAMLAACAVSLFRSLADDLRKSR